jgi:hypothetical protein
MGDDTNSALAWQGESLTEHGSDKKIISAVVGDAFEKAKQTVISKSLEVAVSQMDQRLHDLNERTALLEKSMGRQLAHKEDIFSDGKKNQQLQMIGEDLGDVKAGISTTKDASMLDAVLVRLQNLEKAVTQDNAAIKALEKTAALDAVTIKNLERAQDYASFKNKTAAETKTTSAEATAVSESLQGTVNVHEAQLRRLQDRTEVMKTQLKELKAQMETKAGFDNIALLSQSLAACNREFVHLRDDQLPKQMAHKADVVAADKQRMQLKYVEEQNGQLMSAMGQLMEAVGQKADISALDEQQQQLTDMDSDFRMDLEELATMVDNKTDGLKGVCVRLQKLEAWRSADKEITVQLAEQCKETTTSIAKQAQRCTHLEDVFQKLQLQDQRVIAVTAESDKNAEHVKTQLAHKPDRSVVDSTGQGTAVAPQAQTDLGAMAFQRPASPRNSRKNSLPAPPLTLQQVSSDPVPPPRSPKRTMTDPSRARADLPSLLGPGLGAATPRSGTPALEASISTSNRRPRSRTRGAGNVTSPACDA